MHMNGITTTCGNAFKDFESCTQTNPNNNTTSTPHTLPLLCPTIGRLRLRIWKRRWLVVVVVVVVVVIIKCPPVGFLSEASAHTAPRTSRRQWLTRAILVAGAVHKHNHHHTLANVVPARAFLTTTTSPTSTIIINVIKNAGSQPKQRPPERREHRRPRHI